MIVLALDLGSTTGWAIVGSIAPDARVIRGMVDPISGTWDIAPRRGESPGMRYVHLRRKLEEVFAAYPGLRLVAYEQVYAGRGGIATEYAHACAGTVQAWCAERGLQYTSVAAATLKKHATGKGNAKKDAMMEAARDRGWTFEDDNEADALWVLDYVLKERVA